jgi:S-adenosylmethionine-diacylglycerol 3-amino-3-carboxypropyl transferase
MSSAAACRADFGTIRYGQVWEDADVLLAGLDVHDGDTCLSIASAGDNTLALLTKQPSRVIAIDRSPAQLACLELRVAAYRHLTHRELLELIGSRPSNRRRDLYVRCRRALAAGTRRFWDSQLDAIERGIGSIGKLERYFALFRERILPLVHGRATTQALLEPRSIDARRQFHDHEWDTWQWRALFRVFFSRTVMGRLGRDREFFRYVDGGVAAAILERTTYALRELDPSTNPYLHWVLTGTHGDVLPYALRPEHFDAIRGNLDRLEWHCLPVEDFLDGAGAASLDRFNLSDLFEYVSIGHYHRILDSILRCSRRRARLAYWNMLAPRRRPDHLAKRLRPLDDVAQTLHRSDRAFFYSAFRVEQVQ